ncbi:MAG TPA: NAD(P)H-dependent oxidoreductase, partial [Paracoccaceae bacterium]|nr:NAD(P)H-dependent oxidoreductase [Paracoccaceae bacterium]
IRRADGLILASPGYHGSVSGLVKNAIDYVEDLRDDSRIYLSGRAVGLIACAEGVQALGATLAALRAITHSLRGWPTPYAALIQGGSRPFASDGACQDPAVARALGVVAQEVMEFVALRRAAGAAPPGAAGA